MSLTVTPTGSALGAKITGINISRSLDDDVVARLRSALMEHILLIFPGQTLTPHQLAQCLLLLETPPAGAPAGWLRGLLRQDTHTRAHLAEPADQTQPAHW